MIALQTWADFDREGMRDIELLRLVLAWSSSWPKARHGGLGRRRRRFHRYLPIPLHPRGYWRLALEMHQEPVRHRVTGGGFMSWH